MTVKSTYSDGYHTFDELYEHRNLLFINLCKMWVDEHGDGNVWWNRNGDFEDYFCLYFLNNGKQISYHIPCKYLNLMVPRGGEQSGIPYRECDWDGHTSSDVLDRLKEMAN